MKSGAKTDKTAKIIIKGIISLPCLITGIAVNTRVKVTIIKLIMTDKLKPVKEFIFFKILSISFFSHRSCQSVKFTLFMVK
jgi:hypothetical protein